MFCDFCPCQDCQEGRSDLSHAQCEDGRWICDVCFTYDLCTSGPNRNPNGPCMEEECPHRPKIVSDWLPFNPEPDD